MRWSNDLQIQGQYCILEVLRLNYAVFMMIEEVNINLFGVHDDDDGGGCFCKKTGS